MIKPMLAKATKNLLKVDVLQYVAERKYDGERMLAIMKDGVVTLQRRSGKIATHQYPEIVEVLNKIDQGDFILDGEVVVWINDKDDFDGVAQRSHHKDIDKINAKRILFPATYIVFDILMYEGYDITGESLWNRKLDLNKLFTQLNRSLTEFNTVLVQPQTYRDVLALWEESKSKCWEGIILKQLDSKYIEGGRRKEWLKLKNVYEADLIFTEYEVNNAGILLIKTSQNNLYDDTEVNATEKSPIKVQCSGQQSIEVREKLDSDGFAPVTVEYLNMTKDNKLRMPTFKKLVVK